MEVKANSFDLAESLFRSLAVRNGEKYFGVWFIARSGQGRFTAYRHPEGAFLAAQRTGSGFREITI